MAAHAEKRRGKSCDNTSWGMNAGWTVIVHRHAHEIEREVWDCAIVDRAYAEDAVRQQYRLRPFWYPQISH
jgi:hypothetical protein